MKKGKANIVPSVFLAVSGYLLWMLCVSVSLIKIRICYEEIAVILQWSL